MKKFVAILITAIMMISVLSIPALAEESTTLTSTTTDSTISTSIETDVSGAFDIVEPDDPNAVISVTVTWCNTDFVYNKSSEWNPEKRRYDVNGNWDSFYNSFTVTNNSNCKIKAEVEFVKNATLDDRYKDVNLWFQHPLNGLSSTAFEMVLDSAINDNYGYKDDELVYYVSGEPDTLESVGKATLGEIQINISGVSKSTATYFTWTGDISGQDNDG